MPKSTPPDEQAPSGLSRRRALQVLAAGAAGAVALPAAACAPDQADEPGPNSAPTTPSGGDPLATGSATDPDLVSPVVPWDLVLTEDELETLASLCDAIIPGDERSPGAAELEAHGFIDEWVSAPYDGNRRDLVLVRGGLAWLDVESVERFGTEFTGLTPGQKHEICDDICYEPDVAPEYRAAARFFDRVRDLTSTAFWTTEAGMADLGFVGNRAMASFEGPPREVMERLGLG